MPPELLGWSLSNFEFGPTLSFSMKNLVKNRQTINKRISLTKPIMLRIFLKINGKNTT